MANGTGTSEADLLRRVEALEAKEAIRDLKVRYAAYCDDNYDPEGIASLFVEDGIWETDQPPTTMRSKSEIRDFFAATSKEFIWALHFVIAPTVELSEDLMSATAKWYLFGPMTMTSIGGDQPDAVITTGLYTDEMVQADGRWLFKKMSVRIEQMSNLDMGWVRQRYRGA